MTTWVITTQEFLLSLIDTGQYVHVTDGKKHYRLGSTHLLTDLYFVAWCANHKWTGWNGRVKDVDIISKKYFFIDYDIRSCVLQEEWKLLSTQDLFVYMEAIKAQFTGIYAKRKYIVFSGNWFHVYYEIDNKYYAPILYREAVKEIYKKAPMPEYIDTSCSSISNLARLPWYRNTKVEKVYGITDEVCCEVVEIGQWWISFNLEAIHAAIPKPKPRKKKSYEVKSASDIESIQMPDLVLHYMWFELHANGREFKWNDGNMGMFYDRDRNLLIYNGTKHLQWYLQWYNPYTFVKYEILWSRFTHPRDVFAELKKAGFIK